MTSPLELMRSAVEKGDAKEMRRLLERHAELRAAVNEPLFSFDSPALVHVVGRADLPVVDVLLDFGADPNRKSSWWAGGFHPLHSATGEVADRLLAAGAIPDACAAAQLDRPDLLARMLEADPARVHERGGDGQTPLHFARSRRVVDLLLTAGADLDARDVDHRSTPAQWMLDGRRELARYLVGHGATTDIFLAAALGLTDRVRAMLEADRSLVELRTTRGEYGEKPPSSYHIYMWTIGPNLSPLQVAARFDQQATLDVMRSFASPAQRFVAACSIGDAEEARALLRTDPRLIQALGREDLRALPDAAWAGNAPAVALMIDLGFDPLTQGHDGGTALHCAAWEGSPECVAAILRHPNARTLVDALDATYNSTPLGWCCHGSRYGNRRSDHAGVARLLLEAGARPGPNLGDASPGVRAVIDAWESGLRTAD